MCFTDIILPHGSGKYTGTLYSEMIVKHLDLDICPHDRIIAVSDAVDDEFGPTELRVFRNCDKSAVRTKEGMFFNLALDKLVGFLYHIQDLSFKNNILDHIHFGADFSFGTFLPDETYPGTGEEPLRVPAKKVWRQR